MKGLIFIPDITGFSNFVRDNSIEVGAEIIMDLLKVIVENNNLNMNISEVEGDAVLFYKLGQPLPLSSLMDTFTLMSQAFNETFNRYKKQYNLSSKLALKLIVHYGEIKVYDIFGFKKLYGQAVVETHKLLKNGIKEDEYVLVTDDYLEALNVNTCDVLLPSSTACDETPELLPGMRTIAYHFFPDARRHLVFQP